MIKVGVCTGYSSEDGSERYAIPVSYINSVYLSGGMPVGLFPFEGQEAMIEEFDAIILAGGNDVHPLFMKEDPLPLLGNYYTPRDRFEINVAKKAMEAKIPLLGICRGMQVINVAMGGTVYQDLSYRGKDNLMHRQNAARWEVCHRVDLLEGSIISDIFEQQNIEVNSFHHQAIKDLAPGFSASSYAGDGIIESIEYKGDNFMLGVQWHPEAMISKYNSQLKIFQRLIEEAKKVRR